MTWRHLVWPLVLSLFLISTLVLSWPFDRELFVSPDENAAYVFANQLQVGGELRIPEPLNERLGGILHPRSVVGYGDGNVPASFVGFIFILGLVGTVFGQAAMFLVTPVLAVLSLWLWRDVVKRVFKDESLADAAAFLLMIHPAFWYYSGRVMMHNVAFLALLIAGTWWAVAQPFSSLVRTRYRAQVHLIDFGLAGLLFGAALTVRTNELIWLLPLLLTVLVIYRAVIGWRACLAFVTGLALALGVLGVMNVVTYGNAFVNGYTAEYPYAVLVIGDNEAASVIQEPQRNFLLPFGFHEYNIFKNVSAYGWQLYPWMSILALVGALLVVTENTEQRQLWRRLLLLTLALATWLGLVYGSWMIVDNPDPSIISLGNSHVRYWLPLFALSSIFGAKTILYLLGDRTLLRRALVGTLLILCVLKSAQLVFFGHDGFVPNIAALDTFEFKREAILSSVESDAIVITDRADKYIYPARRVVVPLRSESTYAAIPVMLKIVPVYYFGISLPESDLNYLNEDKLQALGVRIEWVSTLHEESLYRFIPN
jgi:hypothetical protein